MIPTNYHAVIQYYSLLHTDTKPKLKAYLRGYDSF